MTVWRILATSPAAIELVSLPLRKEGVLRVKELKVDVPAKL
jgi:hypothetical protein